MIRATVYGHSDGQWFAEVPTANGERSYGPFASEAIAVSSILSIVRNDFDYDSPFEIQCVGVVHEKPIS